MFNYREFIKKGFLSAVGKMADYQIRLNAAGYYEKGVLLEEDLAEIDAAIEAQYIVHEEPAEDEVIIEEPEMIEPDGEEITGEESA